MAETDRIRDSSQEEYASWYLARERAKGSKDPLPADGEAAVERMRMAHAGKWRAWFEEAAWSVASLSRAEVERLVFLESHWTVEEGLTVPSGPDYRLLGRVAQRALDIDYLERATAARHRGYYERIGRDLRLVGDERIAICSAEAREIAQNPSASYYLLDGAGRALAWTILLRERAVGDERIEAFVAERRT
jgi:hypothetical protein